uniref:Uncharacterized protein n=1 Tax=Oncorhynchus tshawytscha TaxID=74940 RepID=A0AAZ3P371_ONCTS
MDDMGLAVSRSSLERLEFDNVALKKLLLDTSEEPGPRRLEGACFSRVKPKPVVRHRFVAVSNERREGSSERPAWSRVTERLQSNARVRACRALLLRSPVRLVRRTAEVRGSLLSG